jgi:hypothetical protein
MWQQRPRPGIIPLRPISLGEILDGAFQAIRTNPRTMIGVAAVIVAAATLLSSVPSAALLLDVGSSSLLTPGAQPAMDDIASFLTGLIRAQLPAYVVTLLATALVGALLTVCVSNAVLGVRTSSGALWQRVRPRLGAVLALAVITTLVSLAAAGVFVAPGLVVALTGDPLTGVLLFVVGLLPAIVVSLWLFAKLGLAAPALLLEEQNAVRALQRSWALTRGSFWRVLGILFLTWVMTAIGAGIVSAPFALVSGIVSTGMGGDQYSSFGANLAQLLISGVGTILGGAVFYPFTAAVTTLLYLDLRMRREGLDVELVRHVESGPGA